MIENMKKNEREEGPWLEKKKRKCMVNGDD